MMFTKNTCEKILKNYDYVFNVSTNYGSNEEIFINLLNLLQLQCNKLIKM